MPRHVTSRHVVSRNVTSCHVMSRLAPSCNVMPRHVMSRHVISRHVTSCYVISRRKSRDGHTTNASLSTDFFHMQLIQIKHDRVRWLSRRLPIQYRISGIWSSSWIVQYHFSKVCRAEEDVILCLVKSFYMPSLLYGIYTLFLHASDLNREHTHASTVLYNCDRAASIGCCMLSKSVLPPRSE